LKRSRKNILKWHNHNTRNVNIENTIVKNYKSGNKTIKVIKPKENTNSLTVSKDDQDRQFLLLNPIWFELRIKKLEVLISYTMLLVLF